MSNEEVVYEIARYSADGDRLVERFELLSDGTSVRRRSNADNVTRRKRCTVLEAIAQDLNLNMIRGDEFTRITTTALIDELPLILQVPATMPEDLEDPDQAPYNDLGEPIEIYHDREVEVNGQKWFIFDGYLLPTESAASGLAEKWAELVVDTGSTPFSDGQDWGAIGLLNPSVVVSIGPNWTGSGHVVSVKRRGNDARDILSWLTGFRPEDWAAGSGLDSERILAQLFIETAENISESQSVSGTHLAAGIVVDDDSFGVNAWWDLTLNTSSDVAEKIRELLAGDEDFADLITAHHDPESPTARARCAALEEMSS